MNNKTHKEILIEERARIERRNKRCKLANYKVDEVGGYYKNDEMFVQYPRAKDYYISNYGRVISTKKNKISLLKPQEDRNNYWYIQMWNKGKMKKMWLQRAVTDIFCPNVFKYTIGDDGNLIKVQAHHLDHKRDSNYPDNLIYIPAYLHQICNHINRFGIWKTKTPRILHPLDIVEKTGLDLDDIILCARSKPLKTVKKWTIFNVKGYQIALEFRPSFYDSGLAFKEKSI